MRSPSGRVLECGIYRTAAGLEARMGYGEQLLASQYALDIGTAREAAERFRQAVSENERFEPLPLEVRAPNDGVFGVDID
jgi:hypothetical protein